MPEMQQFLAPVMALIGWTLVMWIWLYATRIPAMMQARIDPDLVRHPGSELMQKLPSRVRSVADNYNHLHEQPTIFYALMLLMALTGAASPAALATAWAYVGLRVVHSLVQVFGPRILHRFLVFAAASVALIALAVQAAIVLFAN